MGSTLDILIADSLTAMPMLGLAILGCVLCVIQILTSRPQISLAASLVGLVTLGILGLNSFYSGVSTELFGNSVAWDSLGQFFNLLSIGICLSVTILSVPGLSDRDSVFQDAYQQLPEFLICLVFSSFGVSVLATANDLSALFLGLETLSIGVYCLCGFYRKELRSTESAFKYLLIGGFSTAIFLYGVAFIYGATGATNYSEILSKMPAAPGVLSLFGTLFLLAGFAFKFALVPFHLYTPDVYEGAPTPVTAYMATIMKVGAVAAALRLFWGVLGQHSDLWVPLWLALCVLSILIGNIAALQQRTLKRLLAFSSISHAGFLGLALAVASPEGRGMFPLLSYVVVYTIMSLGSFGIVHLLENRGEPFLLSDLRGLGSKRFWISAALAVCLLGLAGIPPFAGFMIKFWVLQSLIESGYTGMAIFAVVGSIIGAAYYLRLLIYLFVSEEEGAVLRWGGASDRYYVLRTMVFFMTLLTLLGGIRPQLYADWILRTVALK